MSKPHKTCKACDHYVRGHGEYAPACGRDRTPVSGLPRRACETERMHGFTNIIVARECAIKLDACGPDGRYWVAAEVAPRPTWKFWTDFRLT
jgi:hypothetical protein